MFSVKSPSDLIALLPMMLGYTPEQSLVLALVQRGRLGVVMRVELGDAAGGADALAELASRQDADSAIAVIVSAEAATDRVPPTAYRVLADALASALRKRGIELLAAHVADQITDGGQWRCIDGCGAGGVLSRVTRPGPTEAGRRVYGSRAELVAALQPAPSRVAQVMPLIGEPVAVRDRDSAVGRVMSIVEKMGREGTVLDADLAEVAVLLLNIEVREMLLTAAAAPELAVAAGALWESMVAALSGRFRTEALVMYAVSAYLRGEGVIANEALTAALAESPDHVLAQRLLAAVSRGMHPDHLQVILSGLPSVDEIRMPAASSAA